MATKDHVRGGQDANGTRLREPSASVRLRDGIVSERPLRRLTAGEVVAAGPWRAARSARGQAHYPGYYWSATSGGHVIYESRLELARLLVADFDPGVTAIAAQPFLLRAQAGGRVRRHVPDFLLVRADHTVQVVNVKPAARLADPVGFENRATGYDQASHRGQATASYSLIRPPSTGVRPIRLAGNGMMLGSSVGARRFKARWGLPLL
jgi:hypothetical protein